MKRSTKFLFKTIQTSPHRSIPYAYRTAPQKVCELVTPHRKSQNVMVTVLLNTNTVSYCMVSIPWST